MTNPLTQILLALLTLAMMTGAASAQSRTFYDSSGTVVGQSATESSGTTTNYDARGQGHQPRIYDAVGRNHRTVQDEPLRRNSPRSALRD
jgi:hypothetical protein